MSGLDDWGAALWRTSWQGGALVLLVWITCRLFPRLPAAYRSWLWWLACLRLGIGLLALPPVPVALLPAAAAPPATAPTFTAASRPAVAPAFPPESAPRPSPVAVLFACWMAGVLLQSVLLGRSFLLTRRLRREADPVLEGPVFEEGARLSRLAGLRQPLPILTSAAVQTPMLIGPFAPALLLPADAAETYPEAELRMALAHEIAHARRGDLWLGLVPGLVQVLLFFHPLAWLACREWALAREAACDSAVLTFTQAAPAAYGRLLVRLAGAGPAPSGALSATPGYRSLERRLRMLRNHAPATRRAAAAGTLLTTVFAAGLLPWQLTARAAPTRSTPLAAPSRPGEPRITGEVRLPQGPTGRPAAAAPQDTRKAEVITAVSIQGATAFTQAELRKVMKTRVGEAFAPDLWEADQVAVSRLYQDKGYQVRLAPQGPEKGRLTLTLQELRVGKLEFKWKQEELKRHAELVREKLQQKPGALYNQKQLQDDFRAIRALELFATINPMVEVGEDMKIVVTWELGKKE